MADTAELVTVPGVPIARTGIEYMLASGPATFTSDDLRAAVAALDDPGIRTPRAKLGHHVEGQPTIMAEDGSTPAVGYFTNLRLSDDGQAILADWEGVPAWLAQIAPSAFPNRSIEGSMNVQSGTGRHHQFVIYDVALLGVAWPGITTLLDAGTPVAASYSMPHPRPIVARVDAEEVRRNYYTAGVDNGPAPWSHWIVEQYVDPPELIVMDEDTGDLFRVPYTASGDTVTYGAPVPVRREYVDQSAAVTAGHAIIRTPVVTYATRAASRPPNPSTLEDPPMAISDVARATLLRSLNLPADATDEQLSAALEAAPESNPANQPGQPGNSDVEENPGSPPAPQPTPTPDQPNPAPAPAPAQDPAPAQPAGVPEGMVLVEAAALNEIRAETERTRAERVQREADEDRARIEDAIRAGRIAPSQRDIWGRRLQSARQAGDPSERELLASLPQVLPVSEIGTAAGPDDLGDSAAAEHDAYMRQYHPHAVKTLEAKGLIQPRS
jgi:hypothetical protein